MAASKSMTSGKAKKSGAPRKAPKVKPPNPINGNYMKEADIIQKRKSAQQPMTSKRLSK
jgi:hypothetical protein